MSTSIPPQEPCAHAWSFLQRNGKGWRGASEPQEYIPLCTGHIVAEEAGASGDLPSTIQSATWAFSVQPQDGWGPRTGKQAATAGWLASLPVFEPHWQASIIVPRTV